MTGKGITRNEKKRQCYNRDNMTEKGKEKAIHEKKRNEKARTDKRNKKKKKIEKKETQIK